MSSEYYRKVIDARELDPRTRHGEIFNEFMQLMPGGSIDVVVDHKPDHLLALMKHEGLPVDDNKYKSEQRDGGSWVGTFTRRLFSDDNGTYIITNYDRVRKYNDKQFSAVPVFSSSDYNVLSVFIKAGQAIPVHSPNSDLIFVVQKGKGITTLGNNDYKIDEGSIIVVRRGQRRGIKAETDIEALHIVFPPPGEHDHDEVVRKISENEYY